MVKFQKHQKRALLNNLSHLRLKAIQKRQFLIDYSQVYSFPVGLTKKNIRDLTRLIEAIDRIQAFDIEHIV